MTKFELFLLVLMPILCSISMGLGYLMCERKFNDCGYELKSHYIPSTNWVEVIKIDK